MQLRCEDFFKILSTAQHHLHPNSRILSEGQILIFKRMARQNPPVLQPLEMVCSVSQHPLSSVSCRRRYNTLDFPTENRVPTERFHPYWKPRIQGICHPLENLARLCMCSYKLKNSFSIHIHKRKKSQRTPPARRGILWDFHYAAFIRMRKIHAALVAVARKAKAALRSVNCFCFWVFVVWWQMNL